MGWMHCGAVGVWVERPSAGMSVMARYQPLPFQPPNFGIDRILFRRDQFGMQTVSYTEARNQLAGLMDAASRDREPITITRNGAGKVVLLAIEEYEAMETTLHLFSSRANAAQIQQSLAHYEAGRTQSGELCD
jgi:antitoxin YefM